MEIREVKEGDVLVIAPDGSVAAGEDTNALDNKLASTLKAGGRLVVVDCAAVGQLSGAAVRVLLTISRRLDRTGGRLVLCEVTGKLKKAFSISGVDKDFQVVATREEALQRVLEPVTLRPSSIRKKRAAVKEAVPTPAPSESKAAEVLPKKAPASAAQQAPVVPIVAAPPEAPVATAPEPDPREALADLLLNALGTRSVRLDAARRYATREDLDPVASGVLAALRVGRA